MPREARFLTTQVIAIQPSSVRRVYASDENKGGKNEQVTNRLASLKRTSNATQRQCTAVHLRAKGRKVSTSDAQHLDSTVTHGTKLRRKYSSGSIMPSTRNNVSFGDTTDTTNDTSDCRRTSKLESEINLGDGEIDLMLAPVLDFHVGFHHILSFSTLLRWTYFDLWSDIAPRMFLLLISIVSILHAVVMLLMLNAQLTAMLLQYYKVWLEVATISLVAFGLCDLMEWGTQSIGVLHIWVSTVQLIFLDAYRPNRHPVSPLHILYGVVQCLIISAGILSESLTDIHPRQILGLVQSAHMVAASSLFLMFLLISNIWHAQDHPNHFSILSLKVTFTYATQPSGSVYMPDSENEFRSSG